MTSKVLFVFSLICMLAAKAGADQISGLDQISFSNAVGVTSVVSGSYDAAVDGILDTPGYGGTGNGVSLETFPLTVTYNFDTAYDIDSFLLLGEFGSNHIGAIKFFDLVFYSAPDGGGFQIGSVYSGTQMAPTSLQVFDLVSGGYLRARSFSLTPHTDVHDSGHPAAVPGRVELSEMQFTGSVAPPCLSFCSSLPNATGSAAVLTCTGDATTSLVLTSTPVPNTTGQFFYGPMMLAGNPFGDGLLCVGGSVTRVYPTIQAGMMMQLPNTATFTINYSAPYTAGFIGTQNFQHWFRSGLSTGSGFNTSDAVSITF